MCALMASEYSKKVRGLFKQGEICLRNCVHSVPNMRSSVAEAPALVPSEGPEYGVELTVVIRTVRYTSRCQEFSYRLCIVLNDKLYRFMSYSPSTSPLGR